MKITSNFVLLDVRDGRDELREYFADKPIGPSGSHFHLPVTIQGYIYGVIGQDDGESVEFGVNVTDVKINNRQPSPDRSFR